MPATETAKKNSHVILLVAMMIVAALFRFYRLDHQSFWYDELYTVNESNPDISWKQLFYYMQTDQHPPLYFILQRWTFALLGYTEWAARSLSALCGVLAVWAMYFLGKELQGKRLGLIAAALIVANQFSISCAHDARPYSLVWLFAILSYLYFIRAIKSLRNKDTALYVFFTSALIYTNYFAILAVFSQAIMVLVIGLKKDKDRRRFFILFCMSAVAIALSYIPWYRYLFHQTGLKPGWIPRQTITFIYYYYYSYFGSERLLLPFLLLAPVAYTIYLYRQKVFHSISRVNNDYLGFIFIVCSVGIPFIVLFAYSVLKTPVLQTRYTIVVLPGIFLMVAHAINLLKHKSLLVGCVVLFVGLSAYNVIYRKDFYSFSQEMQYRQAAQFMAATNKSYPVLNKVNGWHMRYYMTQNHYNGKLYKGEKEQVIDSVLRRQPGYNLDTFWIVTAFLDQPVKPYMQQRLDSSYVRVRNGEFNFVTVTLYGRKM